MTRFAAVILLAVFPTFVRAEEPVRERVDSGDFHSAGKRRPRNRAAGQEGVDKVLGL